MLRFWVPLSSLQSPNLFDGASRSKLFSARSLVSIGADTQKSRKALFFRFSKRFEASKSWRGRLFESGGCAGQCFASLCRCTKWCQSLFQTGEGNHSGSSGSIAGGPLWTAPVWTQSLWSSGGASSGASRCTQGTRACLRSDAKRPIFTAYLRRSNDGTILNSDASQDPDRQWAQFRPFKRSHSHCWLSRCRIPIVAPTYLLIESSTSRKNL